MPALRPLRHAAWLVFLVGVLAACGGSGGDGLRLPEATTLSTPVAIRASAGSRDGVPLSWTAVPGASTYTVYRCAVPAGVTQNLVASAPVDTCGAPIAVTTTPGYTDVPPQAGTAYVYHVRACVDPAGQLCGAVIASVAGAQAVAAPVQPMSTVIGDDGREVVAGLTTTLHAYPDGATGTVTWSWTQESGPRVTLVDAGSPNLTFTAPDVTVNTLLSFELRVRDDNGPGRPSKVAVTVVPAANVIVKADAAGRQVQAGHEVSLHARGSAQGLLYAWRQLSPATPLVALSGANTDNPTFIAPVLPAGGVLRFEVTATDPVTGRNASARTGVEVLAGVPTPQGPLPTPLQVAQPLQVPPPVLLPSPLPVTTVKVPPQALLLLATPEAVAVGGTSVELTMAVTGGVAPYQWSWVQTSGPTATITNASQDVVTVGVPVVTSAQALTFETTVTDAVGTTRTAVAVVHAVVPPQASGGGVPTPITALQPQFVVSLESLAVAVPLTGATVTQVAGPQLQFTQQASAGGTVVTLTAPRIKADSVPASFTVTGTDRLGNAASVFVPVTIWRAPSVAAAVVEPPQVVPPQVVPRPNDPLVLVGVDQAQVDEGRSAPATFGFAVRGGRGPASYVYSWEYLRDAAGPNVSFTAVRSYIRATVPIVDRTTDLRFRLTVTDGAQQAQRTFSLRVNDMAATLVVGAAAPITVQSGHNVTLSMPSVTGGRPFPDRAPYDYSVTQVSGASVFALPLINRPGNFRFNAPTVAPGAADQVLVFELAATDRIGNVVRVSQQVTVTAPPTPVAPLVARLSLPASVPYTSSRAFTLQASATGGQGPYTYAWTIRQAVTPVDGFAPFVLSDLVATGQNPTVTLPDLLSRFQEIKSYALTVSLRVTDANGAVVSDEHAVQVVTNVPRPGSEILKCGNLDRQEPCTDLDLVLAMTERCPDVTPYGINDIVKIGDQVLEFRRCVAAGTAYTLWSRMTKGNPYCERFDPRAPGIPTDLTCHLACYGNDCNVDTNPKPETLTGEPGPDGKLLVGGRVVTAP